MAHLRCFILCFELYHLHELSFYLLVHTIPDILKRPTCVNDSSISKHFYSSKSNTDSNKRHFSVSIEGNIGSGKTYLLNYFSSFPEVEVLVEPVSKWQDIDGYNALKQFYQDPSRWALTFQTYVQLTMVEQHLHKQVKPIKLMERSIYSAKYCFVENLYKTGIMPELEYLVLSKWFDWLTANQNLQLDLIVYLQTTPETVYHRIKKRCRQEEIGIPLDYLTALHNLHEDWLIHQKRFPVNCPVLVLDGNGTKMDMIEQFEAHKQQIMCQRS